MKTFMVVCEAAADFRIASGLVDRVLLERSPRWLRDLLEAHPEAVRAWCGEGPNPFWDIHRLEANCRKQGVRLIHGHFNRAPGGAGAQAARNAFSLARQLAKKQPIDAVLLIWDMDGEAKSRRPAMRQAQEEAAKLSPNLKIVLGCPDAMSEAWVIAGFDPKNDEERRLLQELRSELGFSPVEQSHSLDANSNKEASRRHNEPLPLKSAKRVLTKLTDDDSDREESCWKGAPLDTLIDRGEHNGLRDYLDDVEKTILPLFGEADAPSR